MADLKPLTTYNFDNILCQLGQLCGADPSGLINYQLSTRPTTAKDIAQLFYCVKFILETEQGLSEQFVDLYNFVKDFSENVQLDIAEKIDEALAKDSFLTDVIIPKLKQWIVDNLTEIVGKTIKQVFFGLTDDGYFVAYIPESWQDIHFTTCMTDECYGRLILEY